MASAITEAASRFGLPERWIRAVIQAESAFDRMATSPVGAMGLMQVMPATYRELRTRYGLGGDPYHPRDNILAGAAYLRELYDRFGASGFLAAYNAGPGRYQEHLQTGRRLPAETRIYVARIAARLRGDAQDGAQRTSVRVAPAGAPDPASAALFVVLGGDRGVTSPAAASAHSELFPDAGLGPSGHE
ncbi:lytic transglycosylase domain-containing protein [Brevundimonas goettingensis]|uniref:lytic transglycosylase domain-containing protein n=1 Tax=Brevundimonas goettingensis TaxID=2774190 RepID=UPI001CEC50A8|nr:lytic transglycosylase domain-containing protein [Brevundimonas goettingensis]